MAAPVRVIGAELWVGAEQLGETILYDGRLHLRIDPRRDGEPWVIETASLVLAFEDAARGLTEGPG
jgi:hypothetical protein